MRRRHRASDLGSSRAVQRLGLVRDRLREERFGFCGSSASSSSESEGDSGTKEAKDRLKDLRTKGSETQKKKKEHSPSLTLRKKNTRKTSHLVHLKFHRAPVRSGNADNNGPSAWQFIVRYFPQELQVEAQSRAFLTCRVVEKVHDVSSKPILEPAAFIEVERAYRIHFDIRTFAQDRAQLALESKRSLSYLRHGERNNAIRHSWSPGVTGEDARRSTKRRSIAGLPAWRSATD